MDSLLHALTAMACLQVTLLRVDGGCVESIKLDGIGMKKIDRDDGREAVLSARAFNAATRENSKRR